MAEKQFKLCEDGPYQLDVHKMTGAFQHPFAKRLTLEIPVDSAHSGVHESNHFRFVSGRTEQRGVVWRMSVGGMARRMNVGPELDGRGEGVMGHIGGRNKGC